MKNAAEISSRCHHYMVSVIIAKFREVFRVNFMLLHLQTQACGQREAKVQDRRFSIMSWGARRDASNASNIKTSSTHRSKIDADQDDSMPKRSTGVQKPPEAWISARVHPSGMMEL